MTQTRLPVRPVSRVSVDWKEKLPIVEKPQMVLQPPSYGWKNLLDVNVFVFVLLHFVALGAFWFPITTTNVILFVISVQLRMFFITGFYHRYFSHRAFKTSRPVQFLMAVCGCTCLQKGPMWWASHHRHHHKFTDMEEDHHSPGWKGFLWAHCGWFLLTDDHSEIERRYIPDLTRCAELEIIEKFHFVPWLAYNALIYYFGGLATFFWAGMLAQVFLWHHTYYINSLAHGWGTVKYRTPDDTRNNWVLAVLTMGEGWHNNHHASPQMTQAGLEWFEFDPTFTFLNFFRKLGLVWAFRDPPADKLEQQVIHHYNDRVLSGSITSKKTNSDSSTQSRSHSMIFLQLNQDTENALDTFWLWSSREMGRTFWSPASISRADYLSLEELTSKAAQCRVEISNATQIFLATDARYWGLRFNPLNLYFICNREQKIQCVIAQVWKGSLSPYDVLTFVPIHSKSSPLEGYEVSFEGTLRSFSFEMNAPSFSLKYEMNAEEISQQKLLSMLVSAPRTLFSLRRAIA